MLCQLRTIGAGIGVLAICFMLASLSWQYLLLGFALASIAWACWSCAHQLRPRKREEQLTAPAAFNPARRRASAPDNVYDFPGKEWGSQTILN
jgi:hypothetical protein